MKFSKKNTLIFIISFLAVILAIIYFLDKGLAVGLIFVFFLAGITFLILLKIGIYDKKLFCLFLIAIFIHLGAVLFISYASFLPFSPGGADDGFYHQQAQEIAKRVQQGNFSLGGIWIQEYSVIIGYVYAVTLPKMIIGQLFGAWLAAISIIFVFLIVREIGGSKRGAFLTGLIVSVYPSYLFYGSLLLKDNIIIPFVLAGILLSIKMLKNFSWPKFLIFYIILTVLNHTRFYIGFAVMFSFIISWFLISNFKIKKRIIYGLIIILLLGFSPQFLGSGYYGVKNFKGFLNQENITLYREVIYAPLPESCVLLPESVESPIPKTPSKDVTPETPSPETTSPGTTSPETPSPETTSPGTPSSEAPSLICAPVESKSSTEPGTVPFVPGPYQLMGVGSSFVVKVGLDNPFKFIKNYFESFLCSLLGPFPWQMKYKRLLFLLVEIIPWYFFFYIILCGVYKSIKTNGFSQFLKRYKFTFSLFMFSIMALGALSLFINNYGIITRIRIPVFISLLCLVPFGLGENNIIYKYLDKIYDKVFSYWCSRFYR